MDYPGEVGERMTGPNRMALSAVVTLALLAVVIVVMG